MNRPATVGWCPGALRPMASGDGLILRVKPRGGRLTLAQTEAVASLSLRFGNGHLDLTSRANLQIRGARPETLDPLTQGLSEAGLLDADAAREALRNIVVSPLAGLDPDCIDVRPVAAALEACLATMAKARPTLPAKWSFVVDGGGRLPLDSVSADLRFRFERGGIYRIGLDTVWSEATETDPDLPALLEALVSLQAAQPAPGRMRPLLVALGSQAVFTALGLRPASSTLSEQAPVHAETLFAASDDIVAFAPSFGALPAKTLLSVVQACRATGAVEVRLSPWRVLFAAGVADRPTLFAALAGLDLILAAGDPRLAVSACVGAPACHRAASSTRADAALLAARREGDRGDLIHVSGCAKGCGHPAEVGWMLIGRNGRYDLHRGGEAEPRIAGLSSTEAANWLSRAERARIV